MDRKVNLFLVGAMKAGTTAIMDLLSQHPEIYTSPIKEPHFFVETPPKILYNPSRFFSLEKYFKKEFPNPLHIANVERKEDYWKLFSGVKNQKYLLEGSTLYLHAPNAAKKIHSYNSDAIILIAKRDPLKRAFSHYNMLTGLSRELRSFETVIEEEIAQYQQNRLPWYSCLAMSFYNSPIARYEALFDKVITIDFQDFSKDSSGSIATLFRKLGLEENTIIEKQKVNTGRNLKYKKFFYVLKKTGIKDVLSSIFPSHFRQWVFHKVSGAKQREIPLSPAVKKQVVEIFKNESG